MSPSAADVCIVGGGVAGCVAARTLADAGAKVLLLEAGSGQVPAELRSLDWLGKADDTPWLWPGEYLRGRGLGGGSAINGMVATFDTTEFYDRWPTGWQYKDLSRYIYEIETRMNTTQPPAGKLSQAIDHTTMPAFADNSATATSLNLLIDESGHRRTFADAFLTEAPATLEVRTDTEVRQVVVNRRQVTGVVLNNGDQIDCAKVVLCAGTYGTADLLTSSGIKLNPSPVQDHSSQATTLQLTEQFQTLGPDMSPASTSIAGQGFEILVLDHLGEDRKQGALMVGETEQGGLASGVRMMTELGQALITGGVATRSFKSPGGYYHAASTLPGGSVVDRTGAPEGWSRLHIMDASVMPSLVRCSPSLTIAAIAAMVATNLASD